MLTPVGAAEGCDLLILIVGGAEIVADQKIAAFGSSYRGGHRRHGVFESQKRKNPLSRVFVKFQIDSEI
ncbi:hypothetical protein [Pseudomonas frederiksbergensis]|uniref:hypothetical protein n=1 Tax=Pseudomonas frederiksbergensis TaxID=104087 RepID=UPI0013D224A1|nr:hypothetical protein [Pseudomonas frederiksbergensis]